MNHLQEQAKKLVGQMTLLEKATLCTGATYWTTAAVERLGLQACVLSDGPHGVRKVKGKDHLTHIRDNDTSCRSAPKAIETGGVPAVCVALGQATVLWGYDAVPTAAQNIPHHKYGVLSGVRGKYDKLKSKLEVMGRLCLLQSLPIVVVLINR